MIFFKEKIALIGAEAIKLLGNYNTYIEIGKVYTKRDLSTD